jgi:hypothetical protein
MIDDGMKTPQELFHAGLLNFARSARAGDCLHATECSWNGRAYEVMLTGGALSFCKHGPSQPRRVPLLQKFREIRLLLHDLRQA